MLAESPTGFINTQIFCEWFDNVFINTIREKRQATGYDGDAVLIMDGFIAHHKCVEDPDRASILEREKIKILFIPPHSSDQVQPLDLVTFNLQKTWKQNITYITSYQTRQILQTYNSLLMASTPHYIKAAFERAGIYRKRLQFENGTRLPQYHFVNVKFNHAIRRAAENRNDNYVYSKAQIEMMRQNTSSQRKTIPIDLVKL